MGWICCGVWKPAGDCDPLSFFSPPSVRCRVGKCVVLRPVATVQPRRAGVAPVDAQADLRSCMV